MTFLLKLVDRAVLDRYGLTLETLARHPYLRQVSLARGADDDFVALYEILHPRNGASSRSRLSPIFGVEERMDSFGQERRQQAVSFGREVSIGAAMPESRPLLAWQAPHGIPE